MMTAQPKAGRGFKLLDNRMHLGRRATPDSDVLASSDEEFDFASRRHSTTLANAPPAASTGRRASSSWLADVAGTSFAARKMSHTSTNSQPPTPSGESGPWASNSASTRPPTANSLFVTTQLWSREQPPSRLTEVVQSPTSTMPENYYTEEPSVDTSAFPFPIPTHPNRKVQRSLSYSVGQMEADSGFSHTNTGGLPTGYSGRVGFLKHQHSKRSLLGDLRNESSALGQLREDEDDESVQGSEQGVKSSNAHANMMDGENHSNSSLRKQAAIEHARLRAASTTAVQSPTTRGPKGLGAPRSMSLIESDYAIEEPDDSGEHQHHDANKGLVRRYSEHVSAVPVSHEPVDNRLLDNVKKMHWQTSLGFGGLEGPPSRRHSFADIPVRGRSVSLRYGTTPLGNTFEEEEPAGLGAPVPASPGVDGHLQVHDHHAELSYFAPSGLRPISSSSASAPNAGHFSANAPISPYGMSPAVRAPRQLYVVAFKCARADIFYVPEGTGLEVKKGDLVIVEGDRGLDLGQVTHANVSIPEAKRLREEAAVTHYRWLMMFSRHVQGPNSTATSQNNPNGLMAAAGDGQPGAVGGMGPLPHTNAHHNDNRIEAKMIRRLAQNHEIQALREKEGGEAKAKRVCQTKVMEHDLRMEILDAEYQFDYKKLTFFYFADAYINFNDLVTDLFKTYKTRIWMSAVNPASYHSTDGPASRSPLMSSGHSVPVSYHAGNSGPGLSVGVGFGQENYPRTDQQYTTAPPRQNGRMPITHPPAQPPFFNPYAASPMAMTPVPNQYGPMANVWNQAPPQAGFMRGSPYAQPNVNLYTPTTYPSSPAIGAPVAPVHQLTRAGQAGPGHTPGGPHPDPQVAQPWFEQFGNLSLESRALK